MQIRVHSEHMPSACLYFYLFVFSSVQTAVDVFVDIRGMDLVGNAPVFISVFFACSMSFIYVLQKSIQEKLKR